MDDNDKPKRVRRKVRNIADEERKKHRRVVRDAVGRGGVWPLDAPGMPSPGVNFVRLALTLGDQLTTEEGKNKTTALRLPADFKPGPALTQLYRRALREPGFTLPLASKGVQPDVVTLVPGHIWGQHAESYQQSMMSLSARAIPVDGPHPADVMIVGKMPWRAETIDGRNMIGPTGEILNRLIRQMHIRGAHKWYVTNILKFMPPNDERRIKAEWLKDCAPIFEQELRIVKPKYILCLGAEASKFVLGTKYNVGYMAGRVVKKTIDMRLTEDSDEPPHTAYVMTVIHPVNVAKDPAQYRILESNFGRFAQLVTTHNTDIEETGLDHRACYTLEDALDWVEEATYELSQMPEPTRLTAWDLEWQGQHPVNAGSYVRTIQCSWGEKKAICFVLRHAGGKTAFRDRDGKPAVKRLIKALNKFVKCSRPVGHFLVADMEWAESLGLRLVDHAAIPLYSDAKGRLPWQQMKRGKGWLDTALMNHAMEETAPLGLEMLTMRYTMAPRYDIPLEDWKTTYVRERGIKKNALEGYGDCPDKVLLPYALYDADVTRRIAISLLPLLDCDYDGNNCWEPFWESMAIQKAVLQINTNGICVDLKRIDDLTLKFVKWRARKAQEVLDWAEWHETEDHAAFNIRSVQQVKEFLFGEHCNGKRTPEGHPIRLRPPGAKSLYLEPLIDTAKPPRLWKDLVEKGQHLTASPSTGKMTLGILAQSNLDQADQINMIRDYRFLDQVLKSILRPPVIDEEDGQYTYDDDGNLEYEAGLAHAVDDDGRVRTHIYPTAETGRWKHSRPNLANISKSRDPDYRRLLGGTKDPSGNWVGGDYTYTLRSVLHATPGFAIVEADYKGAELYGMAIMAGSAKMRDHCVRSMLPDKGYNDKGEKVPDGKYPHPDYYDIHSNVACLAFRLNCIPTKKGLEGIGKGHFRTLAKNVIFGIAYGRQAKAIALQAREQGIKVKTEDAQKVIDAIFKMYPELPPFFEEAGERAKRSGWLCHCFGRFRRFPQTDDYQLEGEFERQAMNFPIQGMIASCVNRGIAFLADRIEKLGLQNEIRILLQIHDAVVVEARYDYVEYAQQLIQWAFVDMVEIWPTDLAGNPRNDGPYRLGLDFEVCDHWGEKFSYEKALKVGLDPKFAAKPKK